MKISARSRYGVRLMLELALKSAEKPLFLRDIAKTEEISEKYLSQIVIPLRMAGLIISFRGSKGGYKLAKKQKEITVYDIVKVLEGDIEIVGCIDNPDFCTKASHCIAAGLWKDLQTTIKDKLSAITLEDLADRSRKQEDYIINYNI